MTREEAIEFIAQSVKSDVDMALVADAIKALEQEPCDKCIYSTSKGECQYDDIAETIPTEQEKKTDIDKIEEDIQDYKDTFRSREKTVDEVLDDVLDIISKYRE